MTRTIGFYNPCNLGDLHISRAFVRYVIDNIEADRFVYWHRQTSRILRDIPRLEQRPIGDGMPPTSDAPSLIASTDTIALNTWYPASPAWNKGNGFGCSLNTLYELFKRNLREHFGHKLDASIERFLPTIDFTHFEIAAIDAWFEGANLDPKEPLVFVCNSRPMSGQTRMSDDVFDVALREWVAAHPSTLFILSNKMAPLITASNVVYASDIIGLADGVCDLPECGYVTTKCDIVVGRGSGAYSFAYLADNFLDEKKTMVCFTDDERTARWVYPTSVVDARVLWSNDYSPEAVRKTLAEALP